VANYFVFETIGYIFLSLALAIVFHRVIGSFRLAFLLTFSAIYLHEFAHKAFAAYFGYFSYMSFMDALVFLPLLIVLFMFTGILLPPPIYTLIFAKQSDGALYYDILLNIVEDNAFQMAVIAIAGPLINLILAIISYFILKFKFYDTEQERTLFYTMLVFNSILFIINMIPIFQGSDGYIFMQAVRKLLS